MPGEGVPHICPKRRIDRFLRVHDVQDLVTGGIECITKLLLKARECVADRFVVFHALIVIRTSFGTDFREDRTE